MTVNTDGIILDIDGTLWDSTNIVSKAWNRAAKEGGAKRTEYISPDLLKSQFGKPMDEIADNIFFEDVPEKRREIMELCCRYEHEELTSDPCRIAFPGVIDTIKELSGRFSFYIVSNCQKGYIELFCGKTGLTDYIRDFECFGNTGKGKAENISLLVRRNKLKEPVYIGDTDGDRIACSEAGVLFIYAEYGFGQVHKDDYRAVITKFGDIRELLEEA